MNFYEISIKNVDYKCFIKSTSSRAFNYCFLYVQSFKLLYMFNIFMVLVNTLTNYHGNMICGVAGMISLVHVLISDTLTYCSL
jgi:hypothetical protein